MLIKPHIFRVRLFDRWWFGYAIAGRQPVLAASVTQLQEWFGDHRPLVMPKTWCSHYWRYLETHQGKVELVLMDHLAQEWSSQPGWFWSRTFVGARRVLCRFSKAERGISRAPEFDELLGPRSFSPSRDPISVSHSTR